MARKRNDDDEQEIKRLMTAEEIYENIEDRVAAFCRQFVSLPRLMMPCEVMDVGQLRDAMGLRVMPEGDAWQAAEQMLKDRGMTLHRMGNMRVMFLRERDDFIEADGWTEAEEV